MPRDKLIHDYNEVDKLLVWDVAENRVPELLKFLEPLISEDPEK